MNIVILAGGTGSIALQTGLYNLLDSHLEGIDTKILVNAYDDGLSTGQVRRVMGGNILGPSDVRKNQTTRLTLEDPKSPWLPFLNIRFTVESSEAKEYCKDQISKFEKNFLNHHGYYINPDHKDSIDLLNEAVDVYFESPVANKIDYNDFSLANIIYAGFAKANKNSLREAAHIMSLLMGIKDNVLLNDDASLFLGAITKSGKRITDEGDIVSWGNMEDPFIDIFFSNPQGNIDTPILCQEAHDAIMAADMVILSSGTQWSSLIPTYASSGFRFAINNTPAKILMVMNRVPDKDSPGQTASQIIDILVPRFFDEGKLHVILDPTGHPSMNHLEANEILKVASYNRFNMTISGQPESKHESRRLGMAIAQTYFKDYLNSDFYMFDYDDTLVGRGNKFPKASHQNVNAIAMLNDKAHIAICTGNSIKAINLRGGQGVIDPNTFEPVYKKLTVFADGGVNKYSYDMTPLDQSDDGPATHLQRCANNDMLIPFADITGIISALKDAGIPLSKIENRGSAIVSIKPIDPEYRPIVQNLVSIIVDKYWNYVVRSAGRTTIEICHPELSKLDAIEYIFEHNKPKTITYVGDELDSGNDAVVRKLAEHTPGLKCLHVPDPVTTAFFIMTLTATIKDKNVSHD